MKPFLISSVVFVAVAEAIAVVTAGSEDQFAFIFWTTPAALLISGTLLGLSRLLKMWRLLSMLVVLMLFGAGLGVLWTFLVAASLGPWIGAFGAPILLCWIAGGAAAGCALALSHHLSLARAVPLITAVSIAVSFAVFLIPIGAKKIANDQRLLTFVFRYVPGTGGVTIDEQPTSWDHEERLTEQDRKILANHYRTGHLDLEARHSNGSGPESRAIIVVHSPVKRQTKLPQPDRSTVYYFQTQNGFERLPPDAGVLDRSITLDVREYQWEGEKRVALSYLLDSWDGSATGADAIHWSGRDIEQMHAPEPAAGPVSNGESSPPAR